MTAEPSFGVLSTRVICEAVTLGILMLHISLNLPPHSYTYIWDPCIIWLDTDAPYHPRQLREKT